MLEIMCHMGIENVMLIKSQIEIDPVAAKHVRDIFTWKMEGMSNS